MEWIVEGVAFIPVAAFVAVATAIQHKSSVTSAIYVLAIGTLCALAIVSLFTGFRIAFLPFRLCPIVSGAAAALIAAAAWL